MKPVLVIALAFALALPAGATEPLDKERAEPPKSETRKPAPDSERSGERSTTQRERTERDGEPPRGDTVPGGPSAGIRDPRRSEDRDKQESKPNL